jgi:iron complex outermembrane recepter protein
MSNPRPCTSSKLSRCLAAHAACAYMRPANTVLPIDQFAALEAIFDLIAMGGLPARIRARHAARTTFFESQNTEEMGNAFRVSAQVATEFRRLPHIVRHGRPIRLATPSRPTLEVHAMSNRNGALAGATEIPSCAARIRTPLVRTAVLAALTAATAANAQEQSSANAGFVLDEVTVTAERLGRSLMDTSTSIVVLDAQDLERRAQIEGARDLLARIPNITTTGTGNFAPAVRGVDGTGPAQGADAFLAGTRPRLNVQIDGRPASYNEVVFGDVGIWDVAQVEVLRGPQSALQGRNAIAGTLAVKTNDPTYDTQARVRVVGGNYKNREYAAAFSAPLVDEQLAFRVAAQRKSSESFIKMRGYEGVSDPREIESTTARAKLLIEPKALAGFSTVITLNHSKIRSPQGESAARPFNDHLSSVPVDPIFEPRTNSGIIGTKWEINDALTFSNTLAYTDFNIKRHTEAGSGNANIDGDELVAEPLLHFTGLDGRLSGLGGLYYFKAQQDEFIDLIGGGTFNDRTETKAAFGEATYALTDRFDVTFGARLESEHRERVGSVAIFAIDLDETYEVFLPKLVLTWHAMPGLTVGTVVGRGYNGGSAGFTYSEPFESYTFDPEYVWNYEAFVRASLADGKVALIGNVFFSQYKDMQLPFSLSELSTVIRNADKAETYGVELGAKWRPVRDLELFGEVGLLQTKVTSYPGSGIEGNDLPRSPATTANVGMIYDHPSGLQFTIEARYSEAYYSDVLSDPRGKIDPYWLANAQVGYTFSRVKVFAYGSNLFDADDPIFIYPGATPAEDSANILRPRTYGVGVQVEF